MKQHKFEGIVNNILYCGAQIWVQRLQEAKNGCDICISLSNGYTSSCVFKNGKYIAGKRDLPDISMFRKDAEILAVYYQPGCDGLEQGANELASFMANHSIQKELWLIGHSKSADPQNDVRIKLKNANVQYKSINVVFASAALGGSDFASIERFHAHKKRFGILMELFRFIGFQNYAVELDVSPDSKYVKSHAYVERRITRNYVTTLSSEKLSFNQKCIRLKNIEGLLNAFFNWTMYGGSDGIVAEKYQIQGVSKAITRFIYSPHCHGLEYACKELVKEFPNLA